MAERCDECAPEYTCFNGQTACRKQPAREEVLEKLLDELPPLAKSETMRDFARRAIQAGQQSLQVHINGLRQILYGARTSLEQAQADYDDDEDKANLQADLDRIDAALADAPPEFPAMDLLRKFVDGSGGRRTGDLMRRNWLQVTVTPEGLAALRQAGLWPE